MHLWVSRDFQGEVVTGFFADELNQLVGKTQFTTGQARAAGQVPTQSNDAVDAEAICEAVTRPTMRFVEIKSEEQQALLSLHRARDFIVRQRTQLINMVRSLAAEFGITIARGVARAIEFARSIIPKFDT